MQPLYPSHPSASRTGDSLTRDRASLSTSDSPGEVNTAGGQEDYSGHLPQQVGFTYNSSGPIVPTGAPAFPSPPHHLGGLSSVSTIAAPHGHGLLPASAFDTSYYADGTESLPHSFYELPDPSPQPLAAHTPFCSAGATTPSSFGPYAPQFSAGGTVPLYVADHDGAWTATSSSRSGQLSGLDRYAEGPLPGLERQLSHQPVQQDAPLENTEADRAGSKRGVSSRAGGGTRALPPAARNGSPATTSVDPARGNPSRASARVTALAASVGPRITDKSCKKCRARKVRCDRKWPRCNRCRDRNEDCDFGTFVPVDAIPESALAHPSDEPAGGVAALQARIAELEQELAMFRSSASTAVTPAAPLSDGQAAETNAFTPMSVPSRTSLDTLSDWAQVQPFSRPYLEHMHGQSLSETISNAFERGVGLSRPGSEADRRTIEVFLHGAALRDPAVYALASNGLALLRGPPSSAGELATPVPAPPTEHGPSWQLAKRAMSSMLVVHLIQSFFASCCAYLPAFNGWHRRRLWILHNLDNLDPASQVSVAAFCAMGARTTQHSAILGISMPEPTPGDWSDHTSTAGARREQACRALHAHALDLVHATGIAYGASRENLEALMVITQMLIFNELVPHRSRATVHIALGQFKELQEEPVALERKNEALTRFGLPLLACDAQTAASAPKRPLVSPGELGRYFSTLLPADPLHEDIQRQIRETLDGHSTADGRLSHQGIDEGTNTIHAWLVQIQRLFAQAAAPRSNGPPMSLANDIRTVWIVLDRIHQGIRQMQELLVPLDYTPAGCAHDKCADQHLRFVTRLDIDVLICFFLVHKLVMDNLGLDHLKGTNAQILLAESEKRLRKALKLIAFYLELYISSRDPHLTYHVVWQLEFMSNWTSFAVQSCGEPGGPADPELQITEVELDWLDKGLVCASYYHPIAGSRLRDLRAARHQANTRDTTAPTGYAPRPPASSSWEALQPLNGTAHPASTTSEHGHGAAYFPTENSSHPSMRAATSEDFSGTGMPFQTGVTAPEHARPWGVWNLAKSDGMTG